MMGTSLRQKQQQPPLDGLAPISESEFSFTIARVAVAQICQSVGFKGAQNSALEALTDITTRYLEAIAKLGAASCNSNGRSQSNLPDFIVALEDLASIQAVAAKRSFFQGAKRRLLKHKGDNKRWYCNGGSWRHVPSWLPPVPVVEEQDKEAEGKKGEVKWECWEEREEEKWECGRETVERKCDDEILQVSGKRGKVRFRMGVGIR
ncbi:Transcription initiation factor TFIID subunit [Sesamum angolense]|uniref:Transcription initiation factor TFIID subunit n=1 Tax=Sesamum angolense TaxID=2727404 RepID=A0AAE1W447_9LAMI|nr:Transcription initiation factor TFIID subunit [Sesamum angolense]